MSGCGCFGRLFNKRGKSLPPGGTQIGKNDKKKKNNKKDSYYKSLPSLANTNNKNNEVSSQSPRSEKTESGLNNIKRLLNEEKNNKSSATKTEENIYDNDLIIPAPLNFREKAVSKESINSADGNYSDDDSLSLSLTSEKEHQNKEIDFLNQLNKDLNSQLNSQSYNDVDELKSAASVTSGNITLKPNPIKRDQNQPQLEPNYATIGSIIKSTQKLFESSNEIKTSLPATGGGNNSTKKSSNLQASVTFKDQDSSTSLANHTFQIDEIQKIVNGFNIDKDEIYNLKSENKSLLAKIEGLQNQLLERESKYKKENDLLIERIHSILTKDTRSEKEVESLAKIFIPLQHQSNQIIINEQSKIIEDLKSKCNKYENELKKPNDSEIDRLKAQIESYKEEILVLRKLVHKLNIELSKYQSKYPSESIKSSLKNEKSELSGLPYNGSIPIWLVNVKYLSPLIASYDERIKKKDEKLKLLKKKLDDLSLKLKSVPDENNQSHSKLNKKDVTGYQLSANKMSHDNLEQIRHHALLVLEENKVLREDNEFLKRQLLNNQKQQIAEIGDLSKKLVINESEKTDLKNQIQLLKTDYDGLLQKYNETLTESQRRVKLQEHLAQTGELKRKLDEINILHKHELNHTMSLVETLESEKKELLLKNIDLSSQNKKLIAENQVLDKEFKEGIGRKVQRRIKELEKRVELAELKEKTAYVCLEKLKKQLEKSQIDKEAFENLARNHQIEIKKAQNKLAEENLKNSKLEVKIDDLKEKSAEKISNALQKIKNKESEFNLIKLESDKRISDILNLLQKKQDQIDEMIKEKRQLEAEVETIWQATTAENRRLKEAFLEMKYDKFNEPVISKSSYHRLLLEEE